MDLYTKFIISLIIKLEKVISTLWNEKSDSKREILLMSVQLGNIQSKGKE